MKGKRVGVLLGGQSSERPISLKTGHAISGALQRLGYDVVEIDAGPDLAERLKAERVEVAFIALHGPFGEDGCVQGLLEVIGIPYTGSGVLASSVAMDKRVTKELLAFHGIPTPAWTEVNSAELDRGEPRLPFPFPAVVKPVAEGSTVGIHIVPEERQLSEALKDSAQYGDRLLIEAYIPGREVTVGVLNGQALPVIEIVPHSGFFDFEAKYTKGKTDYLLPAPIGEALTAECQALALRTYRAVGCEGVARADIRIDPEGRCFVLEINTIPGMTETSLIPKAAREIGLSFEDVCERILNGARLKTWRRELHGK
jgi:D-alanine-D-alanine ligase